MISVLLYSHEKKELSAFVKLGKEIVCRISDDDWIFLSYSDRELVYSFLSEHPIVDISCVDIVADGGIALAEELRKANSEMHIILLADMSVSPVSYIRPSIMAGSLLLRPLTVQNVKSVFTEAVLSYVKKLQADNDNILLIENRDGRQPVPYSSIIYFESREKKIYVNTGVSEYPFYDTLDNLEKQLPDGFLRCHRSYIVAKNHIKKIFISQSTIVLDDDSELPLSRSYKSVFKELK